MRYFLEFSYNGKAYHGWQRQPNVITVQEVLEKALCTLLRTELEVTGAGRTDTGVHAREMFAHFDFEMIDERDDLVYRLNSLLPEDIAVKGIHVMLPEAHARFDALSRSYEYHITRVKDPFLTDFAYRLKSNPDMELMNQAANMLLNYDNFKCFSRSNTDVKTYICNVTKAEWVKNGDAMIFHISADRFLRNMVRAVVGTLLEVGSGRISIAEFETIINSQDRRKAGASAPAHGLYLTRVEYPRSIFKKYE
ncbi:tRNA pseudouridine(38-40) synthase TruA [Robertkochia solimangrovi]|uniref:tRNA pseudouridine(38-40) synthase TruA n=1 Tax=Robertkochia solimangrovi TaxID=2213046 RepID=UPI00117F7BBB|nr:tRNA pseudouridine(38-40) synthase TruA [Robertkochia solimangrovi]TRZ41694.1 tRNA pseudouridine(38-40) synthase TruA [Robertkochia solimangrovi]